MPEKNVWRWAVAGPGRIARRFARALCASERAEITEVYSGSIERAKTFAEEFSVPDAYGSYDAIKESRADIFYLANLNTQHYESAKLILQAGKHLLCEKPICLNKAQAEELFEMARARNLFLMEGMWTSMQPVSLKVHEWIRDGGIGEVSQVDLSFGFSSPQDASDRIYVKKLGGSALLDLGVYGIAYTLNILGRTPRAIKSAAAQSEEGVDTTLSYILDFGEGRQARGVFSSDHKLSGIALISGEKGFIRVPGFHAPHKAFLYQYKENDETELKEEFTEENRVNGFEHEIAEVTRCLDEGLTESPRHPAAMSLAVMGVMDEIRDQIGLHYEGESV